MESAFIHMKPLKAKIGTHVKQGEIIGHVGKTGPHLNWVPPQQAQSQAVD